MKEYTMDDYKKRIIRIIRYSIFFLSFTFLGIITPYKAIFIGLALGTFIGLLNFIVTVWKVNQIGEIAAKKVAKGRPAFNGMASRFALVIIAVMLVFKFPNYINLFSMLIGLFVTQIIIAVDSLKHNY